MKTIKVTFYHGMKPLFPMYPKYFYILPIVSFSFDSRGTVLFVGWLAWFMSFQLTKEPNI